MDLGKVNVNEFTDMIDRRQILGRKPCRHRPRGPVDNRLVSQIRFGLVVEKTAHALLCASTAHRAAGALGLCPLTLETRPQHAATLESSLRDGVAGADTITAAGGVVD